MEVSTPPPPELRPPQLQGLLSRTLSSSPIIKWILPARIRSPSKHDVLFIGDNSVHLREFVYGGEPRLAEPLCSITFEAEVMAADIVSATISIADTEELIVRQSVESEHFSNNGRPVEEGEPAQILLLSTTKSELIFVYAREDFDGTVRFIHATRPIYGGIGSPERPGRFLAHDPESRALAVAPNADLCVISTLRPVDEIKAEIDQWQPAKGPFAPFREQRFIQIDGNIVRMDFLQPPKDDPDKVLLVLIVAKSDHAYMVFYRWDVRQPLHRLRPMRSSGQHLPDSDKLPLMLIPCSAPASFLLVTETELVCYNRVTHSEVQRTAHEFPQREQSNVGRPKLWTQWAKPRRHELFKKTEDEVMLIREDGYLTAYNVDVQSDPQIKLQWSPGFLNIIVDTAFCLLPAPLDIKGGDILIACGSKSDGGVFHLKARHKAECIQLIPNDSPFSDLLLLPDGHTPGTRFARGSRIFACCGGGLAEIRHGVEAEAGLTMEHPDIASLLRIWALEVAAKDQIMFLSTHPLHSSLIILDLRTMEIDMADEFPGVDLEAPTLASTVTQDDTLVQITANAINLVPLSGQLPSISYPQEGSAILCAAIESFSGLIVIAHDRGGQHTLTVLTAASLRSPMPGAIPQARALTLRPSHLCLTRSGHDVIAVLSSESGNLQAAIITSDGQSIVQDLVHISSLIRIFDSSSVSSMCLLSTLESPISLLVCGLRGGYLICLEIRRSGDILQSKIVLLRHLTHTPVSIYPDDFSRRHGCTTAAFIAHGTVLERLTLKPNEAGAEFDRCRVIIQNRNEPAKLPDTINAVARIPQLHSEQATGASGLILCATSADISFSNLLGQAKGSARYVKVPGVAHKLIYSNWLKALVIGVNTAPPSSTSPMSGCPLLCFSAYDRSRDEAGCAPRDESKTVMLGEPGEKISALAHYSPSDDHNHFEMILVALHSVSRNEVGKLKSNSRVLCVSDKHVQKGSASPRLVMRLPGKRVTALCAIGKSGLLIGSNNEVLLHNLDVGTKKWSTLTRHALPSPARQIRVNGSLIYIATEKHSLLILREHNNTLSIQTSDTRARIVSNVLPLRDRRHIIITDNTAVGTQLTGIIEDREGATLQRTFELKVPDLLERVELGGRVLLPKFHPTQQAAEQATLTRSDPWPDTRYSRETFISNTKTGTLYSFTKLSTNEWILCHFLEGLTKPGMKIGAKTLGQELDISLWMNQPGSEGKVKLQPGMMGVNGDVLARMLVPSGAWSLRELIDPDGVGGVKLESDGHVLMRAEENERNGRGVTGGEKGGSMEAKQAALKQRLDTLRALLGRVLDDGDEVHKDVVGSTRIWLRGLLQT